MLKVKVSSRGSGESLNLSQFVGNDRNEWMGCRFFVNEPCQTPDVWIVCEDLDDFDTCASVPQDSVVFVTAETSWEEGFYHRSAGRRRFLDQFAWIYTCHDVFRENVTADLPFLPWMVNANHGPSISAPHERDIGFLQNMDPPVKSRALSVICSNQQTTPGHRMRLRLVRALKNHFGDKLEWFGNGVQPIPEKWTGLAPFKYTIAIENRIAMNVATEKLWDPLLTFTLPIYGGAPNALQFLPEGALLPIDVKDLNGTICILERLLQEDPYEQHLDALREARQRVLGPLNLYSRLARIAQTHARRGPMENRRLMPMASLATPYADKPTVGTLVKASVRRLKASILGA